MSELSIDQAESIRNGFVDTYEDVKTEIEKNFNDMDFENAVQRTEMQEKITSMKSICDAYISILKGMTFL